jgi:hypothetical protein
MGRPRKVKVEVQAPKVEQTETEIVESEPVEQEPTKPANDGIPAKAVEERAALEKRIKDLELKLKEKKADSLEELLKEPTFGTKQYLHLRMENLQDPKNPNLYTPIVAMISVFPNALDPSELDPVTKKPRQLCPDINIDRELGDRIRNTDEDYFEMGVGFDNKPRKINLLVEYAGKTMRVKQAVRLMQEDYIRRKKAGDEQHRQEMDKITRASE